MKTSVVILNWNGVSWLEKFLPSVVKNTPNAKIIVADNGSTDDSKKYVNQNHSDVLFIENKLNLGYAGGYNRAVREIVKIYPDHEFCVFLNSDVDPQKEWLEPLERRMIENPNIGAIQPKILDYNNPDNFEYAGAAGGLLDKWGYPFARGRIFESLEKDKGQYDSPEFTKIFWASGACLMVRLSAFYESGSLDERLFAHMEEIDLCWRMQTQNYDIESCSSSVVFHVGGGTLGSLSPKKTYLNFRNSLLIICKNAPTYTAIKIISARLFLDAAAGFLFLIRLQPRHFFAVIQAHFSFYKMFTRFTFPSQPRKKEWPKNGTYDGSIVWKHFISKN